MKRLLVGLSALGLVACSAILGLQEPVLDNTIGDAQQNDSVVIDAGDGGPLQLYVGRTNAIAMDQGYVYYTANDNFLVGRVAKDGTSQLDLASGQAASGLSPHAVAIDATDVFWTSIGSVHQCKKTGCANSPVHVVDENAPDSGSYDIAAFAVDDASTIYFASTDQASSVTPIYSVPKGVANAPVTLFLDGSAFTPCSTDVQELHYDSGFLYFVCGGGPLGRISTSTKAIEVFTTPNAPSSPDSMVLGGSTIYYSQFTATGSIFSLPVADDAGSTPIALQQLYPTAIDIDQQYVYWTNLGQAGIGSIARCKIGQCSANVTTLVNNLDGPTDVKSDGTYVYYSVHGGTYKPSDGIFRMVNP